jgi:hypothetical protein
LTIDLLKFANKNNIKITVIDLYTPLDKNKVKIQGLFKEKLKIIYTNLDLDYFIYDKNKKSEIIEKKKKSNSKILFSTL